MIPMMHGRTAELAALHRHAEVARSGKPQLVVLYGRRRVGKTFLLRRFLEQLDPAEGAYHACSYLSPTAELAAVLEEPALRTRHPVAPGETFGDYLDAIAESARDRLLVVTLDEFPYLLGADDHVVAAMQRFWDRIAETNTRLLLIITGSAISTMTRIVSSRGPLFARPTSLLQLHPFDFTTSASFLGVDTESAPQRQRAVLEARTACGGYPLLLERWNLDASAEQNLTALAAGPLDPLVAMSNVLLLDLPDARGVRSTLAAIGRGVHKHGEIQSRTDQRIDAALSTLISGGFVQSVQPIGSKEEKGARKQYRIADEHLLFSFAIIDPYRQLFEANQGDAVLAGSTTRWRSLVEAAFEREARDHALRLVRSGSLEAPTAVGEWWATSPKQCQIDVVGIDTMTGDWRFAGEAKWVKRFGTNDLRLFEDSVRLAGPIGANARRIVWVPDASALTLPTGSVITTFTLRDLFDTEVTPTPIG